MANKKKKPAPKTRTITKYVQAPKKRRRSSGKKRAAVKRASKAIARRSRSALAGRGAGVGDLMKLSLITVVGIIATRQAKKRIPVQNEWVKALIPIAIGSGLFLSKYGKKPVPRAIAIGIVAGGLFELVKMIPALKSIAGEDQSYLGADFDDYIDVNNPEDIEELAGEIQEYLPEMGTEPNANFTEPYNDLTMDEELIYASGSGEDLVSNELDSYLS